MADNKESSIELGLVAACPNHANRPGTVRCDSCLRKVCEECLIHEGANKYCSAKCVEGANTTRARVEDLASRPPPPPASNFPLGAAVFFVVVIMGGLFAWQHQKAILGFFQKLIH